MRDAQDGNRAQERADPGAGGADGAGNWDALRTRQATRRDASAVVGLLSRMLQDMASYSDLSLIEPTRLGSQLLERFLGSFQRDDHVYLVASMDKGRGGLVGVVEASVVSPSAVFRPRPLVHIHSLYVEPGNRGRGIGRGLLEEALGWGSAMGCAEAELSVLAGNPARKLYERLGFGIFELEMRRRL